jgi:hypothetical protein
MTKKLDTELLENELKGRSAFFQPHSEPVPNSSETHPETTRKLTRKVTQPRDNSRELSRDIPRENTCEHKQDWPTRDEIQELSFRLRDELRLKTKVQSEVPYQWQDELEALATQLKVKKLELYRYIIAEFLGKVRRGSREGQ